MTFLQIGNAMYDIDRLVGEHEAAIALGCSVAKMQKWRWKGGGPLFIKMGRSVRYRVGDLLAYREARTVSNTSQGSNL